MNYSNLLIILSLFLYYINQVYYPTNINTYPIDILSPLSKNYIMAHISFYIIPIIPNNFIL